MVKMLFESEVGYVMKKTEDDECGEPVILPSADLDEVHDENQDEGYEPKFSWKNGYRTKNGYWLKEVVSALQKEIRRGNERQAFYWAHEMIVSGFGKYFWRRLGAIICEEVGIVDDFALQRYLFFFTVFRERVSSWSKGPWTWQAAGGAILSACRAKKNKEVDMFSCMLVSHKEKRGWHEDIPEYALDKHTGRGKDIRKELGWTDRQSSLAWWRVNSKIENVAPGNLYIDENVDLYVFKGKITPEDGEELKYEQRQLYGERREHEKVDFTFPPREVSAIDWNEVFGKSTAKKLKRKFLRR